MSSGSTRLIIGFVGVALLLLVVLSAFAAGAAWSPTDGQGSRSGSDRDPGMGRGMGSSHMMGGSPMGTFDAEQPFDRQFIDRMIPHHAMAIRSAQHMISDSNSPEMRDLADDIVESQSEQIDQMRTWRQEWYGNPGPRYIYPRNEWVDGMGWDDSGMMHRGGGMVGGGAADATFLRMMIPHHEQAIQMSREALASAEHPETRQLAEKIIAEQSAEIDRMRGYLREIE